MPTASLLVAILALLVAAAGAGYAAATVGTRDLENNAVTSVKVKDGSLKATDLVRERKFRYVGRPGAPSFFDGGQGDCVWRPASALVPGLARPGFRTDRFGTVHLLGIAVGANGTGGDETCAATEPEDVIVFRLPRAFWPAKTLIRPIGADGSVVVAGPTGIATPAVTLPPGAVGWSGTAGFGVVLDGIAYQPAGTRPVRAGSAERVLPPGQRWLERLLTPPP